MAVPESISGSTSVSRAAIATDETQAERTLALLRRWGWNSTGFQSLETGFSHYFDGASCVSYFDTKSAWVVAGPPIAAPEEIQSVAARFIEAAKIANRRVCFFGVERRFIEKTGMSSLLLGEQPVWNPLEWQKTLENRRSLREQLRRARAKRVSVRAVSAKEISDRHGRTRSLIEALVRKWLATRSMPAMGFLVDVQLFSFASERRYFIAEREGELVGLLAAVPVFARNGWLFEDLLRDPHAPNGTTELLVSEAMLAVAAEGSSYVTLGLAPLSGPVAASLGRVRRWTSALYDFDGVRAFKSKLGPHTWDPILLAYPVGASPNVALYDVLAAFARGSFIGFGLRVFLRGPALVVRSLSLLCLVQAFLLANANSVWFASPSFRYAWLFFDLLGACALWALSSRWRGWLGKGLAVVMSVATLMSILEVVDHELSTGVSARAFVLLCLIGGWRALIATALWGAVTRHRRMESVATKRASRPSIGH